ncbi:MAG: ATP-binding protein, partial [Actinomycetota bacterium]|nr:ATP-binding protein [Actinomycetota bacterium]
LTAHQAAEAFIEFERAVGGDFFLVRSDDHRIELGNRRCPFGAQVDGRPQLCRVTSATAGGLAARQGATASVTLDERIALGDRQCRLIVDLSADQDRPGSHLYHDPPSGLPRRDPFGEISSDGYRVAIALRLPRDRMSVSLIRHLSQFALSEVGVVSDVIDDCILAVTEACANVLDHAGLGDAYDVTITIGPVLCEIRVIDMGRGFDFETLSAGMPNVDSEQGRGLALMHALMDGVHLVSQPESGTICHLVKELAFDEESVARRLLRNDPSHRG